MEFANQLNLLDNDNISAILNSNLKRESNSIQVQRKIKSLSEVDNEEEQTKQKKKPGRKPTQNDPANKRTAQNRAAQRAFRERKEKYLFDLEAKVKELEEANKLSNFENALNLIQENKQLKETIKNLKSENSMLKDMQFTFDYPFNETQQPINTLPSYLSSPPSTVDATSPFSDSLFVNNISDFNLFPSNENFINSKLGSPLIDSALFSPQKDEFLSFNSSDIFSNTTEAVFPSLDFGLLPSANSSPPALLNQYRDENNDSLFLSGDNEIDKLLVKIN
ncbi:hypothetical protein HK099_002949 [Clydaea vesicula]|uniref:BZIP domain-containing protein n=1 Tax=Clydaea vesicula TaxID=447962 RepID=A0AAD5TUX5_9FUNG|nr:hypothetical protein HK099_002949 [Clydaea vesicula]